MGYEVFSRCIPIENDILYRTRKNKKRNKGKPQKRGCPIGLKPLANGFKSANKSGRKELTRYEPKQQETNRAERMQNLSRQNELL